MSLSYRMMMILEVVVKRNEDGSCCDLDEIIERVDYEVSKQAIQFTLRRMVEQGLIDKMPREKRRGRSRVLFRATELGSRMISCT